VEIVQDGQERAFRGRGVQETCDGIEEPEASGVRIGRWCLVGAPAKLADLGEKLSEIVCTGPHVAERGLGTHGPDKGAQRLHPGPVRRGPARFPTPSPEDDGASVASAGCDLVGEPALADSRFTGE
jgi:hypothetical protein